MWSAGCPWLRCRLTQYPTAARSSVLSSKAATPSWPCMVADAAPAAAPQPGSSS